MRRGGAGIVRDEQGRSIDPGRGLYHARRAAALSGVPLRTLHHWAQSGFFRPSVSPDPRDYLWSWGDLLALRAIDWVRRRKDNPGVPHASLNAIRSALAALEQAGLPRHALSELSIGPDGSLYIDDADGQPVRADASRQVAMFGTLNLVSAYNGRGPDLLRPRPLVRISPGKLHGEPYVVRTRIPTAVLFELHREGYDADQIRRMYPDVSVEALGQAVELERSFGGVA